MQILPAPPLIFNVMFFVSSTTSLAERNTINIPWWMLGGSSPLTVGQDIPVDSLGNFTMDPIEWRYM